MSLTTDFSFNNGKKTPQVGLGAGCWMGLPGETEICFEMVVNALKIGYRHLDAAPGHGIEEAIGRAVRASGIPREEVFVTTKLDQKHHGAVEEGLQLSLKNLGMDYVDLYLMHWPQAVDPTTGRTLGPDESPTYVETWKAMENLLPSGKVKSIGVSNFSVKTLEALLSQAKVIPATNQVEIHPSLPKFELLEYCKSKNILLTAYSPLGRAPKFFFESQEIKSAAKAERISPAQLLVSWAVQRGTVPIPKSSNKEGLEENFKVVKLSGSAMTVVDNFHKISGVHCTTVFKHQPEGVFGWTYDQLGWGMDTQGSVIQL